MSRLLIGAAILSVALTATAQAKSWDEFMTECRRTALIEGKFDYFWEADNHCKNLKSFLVTLYGPNYRPGEPPPPTVMRGDRTSR